MSYENPNPPSAFGGADNGSENNKDNGLNSILTRRGFLGNALGLVGATIGAKVLQGCATPDVSWNGLDENSNTGVSNQNESEKPKGSQAERIKNVLEANIKKHDETKGNLTQRDLDEMYRNLASSIDGLDLYCAKFKKNVADTINSFSGMIGMLVPMWFSKDAQKKEEENPNSITPNLRKFFSEKITDKEIEDKLIAGYKGAVEEVTSKLYSYIATIFQWSGAMYDEKILKKLMDKLVNAKFDISSLANLFFNIEDRSKVYFFMEKLLSEQFDPVKTFKATGVVSSIYAINKMLLYDEDANIIQNYWNGSVTFECFLTNQSADLMPKHERADPIYYGFSESSSILVVSVLGDYELPIQKKLDLLSGKGDWSEFLQNDYLTNYDENKLRTDCSLIDLNKIKKFFENPNYANDILRQPLPVPPKKYDYTKESVIRFMAYLKATNNESMVEGPLGSFDKRIVLNNKLPFNKGFNEYSGIGTGGFLCGLAKKRP